MRNGSFIGVANFAARCAFIVVGLLDVPVPAVLLYLFTADASSAYVDDDAAFLWAFAMLVASAIAYAALAAPAIWRHRLFRTDGPSDD